MGPPCVFRKVEKKYLQWLIRVWKRMVHAEMFAFKFYAGRGGGVCEFYEFLGN